MHLWRLNNVKGVMFVYLGCKAFMQIGVGTSRPDCQSLLVVLSGMFNSC